MNEWIDVNKQPPPVEQKVRMKTTVYGKEYEWEGLIWEAPKSDWICWPSATHWKPIEKEKE